MQEQRAAQHERESKQNENQNRQRGHDPLAGKLEIQERRDRSRAQIREQGIEPQDAVVLGVVVAKLRVDEEQNERDGQYRVNARPPELGRGPGREIDEENSSERSGQRDVGLESELSDLAPQ